MTNKKKIEDLAESELDAVRGGVSKIDSFAIKADIATDATDSTELDLDGIVGPKTLGAVNRGG